MLSFDATQPTDAIYCDSTFNNSASTTVGGRIVLPRLSADDFFHQGRGIQYFFAYKFCDPSPVVYLQYFSCAPQTCPETHIQLAQKRFCIIIIFSLSLLQVFPKRN
jgi:hypothetical protein